MLIRKSGGNLKIKLIKTEPFDFSLSELSEEKIVPATEKAAQALEGEKRADAILVADIEVVDVGTIVISRVTAFWLKIVDA